MEASLRKVIVAVDPGKRACGIAVVDVASRELLRARLVKSPEKEADGARAWKAMARAVMLNVHAILHELDPLNARADLLVVERQRIYPPRRGGPGKFASGTANPNVILDLASVVGGIVALVPTIAAVEVQPSQWKGAGRSAAKEENNAGILNALTPAELGRAEGLEKKSTAHNTIDAIGIGKWAASRFEILVAASLT